MNPHYRDTQLKLIGTSFLFMPRKFNVNKKGVFLSFHGWSLSDW